MDVTFDSGGLTFMFCNIKEGELLEFTDLRASASIAPFFNVWNKYHQHCPAVTSSVLDTLSGVGIASRKRVGWNLPYKSTIVF